MCGKTHFPSVPDNESFIRILNVLNPNFACFNVFITDISRVLPVFNRYSTHLSFPTGSWPQTSVATWFFFGIATYHELRPDLVSWSRPELFSGSRPVVGHDWIYFLGRDRFRTRPKRKFVKSVVKSFKNLSNNRLGTAPKME